jgi:hypothetical protein
MSYSAVVYQVLLASPSDTTEEIKAITKTIHNWNAKNSRRLGVVLMPIKWETHSTPEMGTRPQEILNEQLVAPSDILIGVFWTRLGSDTGNSTSGTVEEIDNFISVGKPVLLYFSLKPIPSDADLNQYQRVREFKDRIMTQRLGLFDSFSEVSELREKLDRHLMQKVEQLSAARNESPIGNQGQEQATDIRRALEISIDTFNAEWNAEKLSRPSNIDNGKRILNRFGNELLRFRPQLSGLIEETGISDLDRLLTMTRTMQNHQVHIDGGVSGRQFWVNGDGIFEDVRSIIDRI